MVYIKDKAKFETLDDVCLSCTCNHETKRCQYQVESKAFNDSIISSGSFSCIFIIMCKQTASIVVAMLEINKSLKSIDCVLLHNDKFLLCMLPLCSYLFPPMDGEQAVPGMVKGLHWKFPPHGFDLC